MTHFVGIQSDISDLVNHKKAELAAKSEAAQVSTCQSEQPHDSDLLLFCFLESVHYSQHYIVVHFWDFILCMQDLIVQGKVNVPSGFM